MKKLYTLKIEFSLDTLEEIKQRLGGINYVVQAGGESGYGWSIERNDGDKQ